MCPEVSFIVEHDSANAAVEGILCIDEEDGVFSVLHLLVEICID